jgi:hypothetical protein
MLALSVVVVVVVVSCRMMLLAMLYVYKKGDGIMGKPELALRFAAQSLASLKEFTRP